MREIILIFEGNEDNERKAADTIQTAIFNALGQERMAIRKFTNQSADTKKKAAAGLPEKAGKELDIPEWLHKYNRRPQEGIQPSE